MHEIIYYLVIKHDFYLMIQQFKLIAHRFNDFSDEFKFHLPSLYKIEKNMLEVYCNFISSYVLDVTKKIS